MFRFIDIVLRAMVQSVLPMCVQQANQMFEASVCYCLLAFMGSVEHVCNLSNQARKQTSVTSHRRNFPFSSRKFRICLLVHRVLFCHVDNMPKVVVTGRELAFPQRSTAVKVSRDAFSSAGQNTQPSLERWTLTGTCTWQATREGPWTEM